MIFKKKFENRKNSQSKIKQIYLRKLSIEMIKRGISNDEIKATLNEVAISLEEFLSETRLEDIEELEEKFGSVELFCDNNMLNFSKEGAFGHTIYNSILVIFILIIPLLGFASFFIEPYNHIIIGSRETVMGVGIAGSGNGFIGTLFGLNIFIWMLYYYMKNRFSRYDIREKIKVILLVLFWLVFVLWLILAMLPYARFASLIVEIWQEGFHYLILNSAIRWLALGLFLGITASLYTIEFRKNRKFEIPKQEKNTVFDNYKAFFVFFVLIGLIAPNPGIGTLIIFIGILLLLLARVTGGIFFLGSLIFLTQTAVILLNQELLGSLRNVTQIIFGFKFDFGISPHTNIKITISVALIFLIIWSVISLYKMRKQGEKFLPKLTLPKKKNLLITLLLLAFVLFAVLGTKPQYTSISSDLEVESNPVPYSNILTFTYTYEISGRGTIYTSIYTYLEYNNTEEGEYVLLDGNWTIRFDEHISFPVYHSQKGDFSEESSFNHFVKDWKIGLSYFKFETRRGGDLEIILEFDISTAVRSVFPQVNVLWLAYIPQLPTFIEIVILSIVSISMFLSWDKEKLIKQTSNPRKEKM